MKYIKYIGNLLYYLIIIICSYILVPSMIVMEKKDIPLFLVFTFIIIAVTALKIVLVAKFNTENRLKRILISILPLLHIFDIGFYFSSAWSNSQKIGVFYIFLNGNKTMSYTITHLSALFLWIALILFFYLCNRDYGFKKSTNITLILIMSLIIIFLFVSSIVSIISGKHISDILCILSIPIYWGIWILFRIYSRFKKEMNINEP